MFSLPWLFPPILLCPDLVYRLTALQCYFLRALQLRQTVDRCQYNVLLIVGAKGLGTNVLDTCHIANDTSRTACDDTGTTRSSLQQNGSGTKLTNLIMCDGFVLITCYRYKMLNCIFFALTDCFRNFGSLTQSGTYVARTITNYYQSCEAEVTRTLLSPLF